MNDKTIEVIEDGLYLVTAVAPFARGTGGTLVVYADQERIAWDSQGPRAVLDELRASSGPKRLLAGQVVIATCNGEPLPLDQLTVDRLDGP